jgi:hypothetical protein
MKNYTKEILVAVATEMYHTDGKTHSESYSQKVWVERGWPVVDNDKIYTILDSYIKFLRCTDEYNETETRDSIWQKRDILGRIKKP